MDWNIAPSTFEYYKVDRNNCEKFCSKDCQDQVNMNYNGCSKTFSEISIQFYNKKHSTEWKMNSSPYSFDLASTLTQCCP